ncbi:response regulator with CheY-like receiver, AAA-type ATPase, and DNA-binding domains [Candidatus Nitrososphaera evergladensis SR1]|uniref:Response regulator with CheY-like receiver, AAA-type ATPase, and DNA-binding domains n=1 Tax=Candidatus Nitrososphaera evergladensis SR1 TaxID=1459636 RepID=A0A075MSY5_9ARCH|nr:response regulator with CheY-like receiver, AAA-type ATPase, and DNA-binding domains [Candidatus Nitrososphaera evergladensis SR1]
MKCEIVENDTDKVAQSILHNLENTFGARVFDALMAEVLDSYLGNEMDALAVIKKRPDLFDRAFVEFLGEPGEKLLSTACKDVSAMLHLGRSVAYSKVGDLVKWMKAVVVASHNPRIMVIDDEQDILTVVETFLQDGGWEVDTFDNPLKALEYFKENNCSDCNDDDNYYSIVLIDVRMPAMSGLDLATELLKIRSDTKILLMTAFELEKEMQDRLPVTKHEDILKKPFQLEQVCTAIKKTMTLTH